MATRPPAAAWGLFVPACLRLEFTLPPVLSLLAPPGRHHPCLHGCRLVVGADGAVIVEGGTREQIFEQARRWLVPLAKGRPPVAIAAVLVTPAFSPGGRGGRDAWSISINAEVSFAATSIAPDVAPRAWTESHVA